MRKLTQLTALVIGLSCSAATTAFAIPKDQVVMVHHGFYKANHYRELPDFVRRAYIVGVFDALMLCPLFGAPKAEVTWLERCGEGMQDVQLQAIVDRFVDAHPERWDEDMGTVAYGALTQACTARGFPPKID